VRVRRAAAVGLALAAVAACGGQQTVPGRPDPAPPGTYVALGDSVAAGAGAPAGGGYVERLVGLLGTDEPCDGACPAITVHNLARGGATTSTLLDGQLQPAAAVLRDAAGPVLVTVTIGGNDVVEPLARACAAGVTEGCTAAVAERYAEVQGNLRQVLAGVRAAAGADAVLAVMTYYNSFQACDLSVLSPLAERVLDGSAGAGLPGFNDLLAGVAQEHDALVVRTKDRIGPAELVGGGDCLHTNEAGHTEIAEAFAEAVGGPLSRLG
jgi:lysophospholipase L1-like esterase